MKIQRTLALLLAFVLFFTSSFVFPVQNALAFTGLGSGTDQDPFLITDCATLAQINDDLIFTPNSGNVIFDQRPNGDRLETRPIVLATRQDDLVETDEFFWLDLSSAQTRINKSVRLVITNDDLAITNTLSNLNLGVTNQMNSDPLAKDLEVLGLNTLNSPNETIV
jgi:hypothetical protein